MDCDVTYWSGENVSSELSGYLPSNLEKNSIPNKGNIMCQGIKVGMSLPCLWKENMFEVEDMESVEWG